MTVQERLDCITGWACERHGLAFETRDAAEEHVTQEGCGWGKEGTRWKSLAELQQQMDDAAARLLSLDGDLHAARSQIMVASSAHRAVRLNHDQAKERLTAARKLWAEQAQTESQRILRGDR